MAEVELTDTAIDQLEQIEDDTSERIRSKLEEVESWPEHYLERLQGHPFYKLRVGDYRVIVDWKQAEELFCS